MPIRFRCVYCEKLLGIARRKAGAVVGCPHCGEKLIVPTPDENEPAEPDHDEPETERAGVEAPALAKIGGPPGPAPLFERIDIVDELLSTHNPDEPPPTSRDKPPVRPPAPPPPPLQQGVLLTSSQTAWLAVAAVIALAVAFGAGIILGRLMK